MVNNFLKHYQTIRVNIPILFSPSHSYQLRHNNPRVLGFEIEKYSRKLKISGMVVGCA